MSRIGTIFRETREEAQEGHNKLHDKSAQILKVQGH